MASQEERAAIRQAEMVAKQVNFINEYPKYGTVGVTCKAIGVARRTFYDWIKDPEFHAVYMELKQDRIDQLVSQLYQFITDRDATKLNQQQLLACFFLLKAFDPATFADKYQLQHTDKEGNALKVTDIEVHRMVSSPDATTEDSIEQESVPDGDNREI